MWIVDLLDGTREYSEPPRDDWAGQVALREDGELTADAATLPALEETFHTGNPPVAPTRTERPRIAVSRTRPPAFVEVLAEEFVAELVPMGSAGVKVISVVRNITDAHVHARRALLVGRRGPGGGGPSRRSLLLASRRVEPALHSGRRVPVGPRRVPLGAGRQIASSSAATGAPDRLLTSVSHAGI